jgi:WD40 repeat protein
VGIGLRHDLSGHKKEIYTVRWTPSGPGSQHPDRPLNLCTASFDGTVKVIRVVYVCFDFYLSDAVMR